MTGEELKGKLRSLQGDPAFIAAMKKADSKDSLQDVLNSYGICLTEDEIDLFTAEVEKQLGENSEISESELEQVSGGGKEGWDIFKTVVSWGKDIWKACWGWGKKFANWEDRKK